MSVALADRQPPGAALRLVREATLSEGPLFSSSAGLAAGRRLGMSGDAAYKALSLAAHTGVAIRLKGGLYRSAPPFGPAHVHEFLVATALVRPSVISGASALSHWGLIDQTPFRIVTASTPKSVVPPMSRGSLTKQHGPGRHGWMVEGVTYIYRRIPEDEMFGFSDVWLDTETRVPMFDRERTVLDAFLHPRTEGGGNLAAALADEQAHELDLDQLVAYAEASGRPSVIARVTTVIRGAPIGVDDANL